MRHVEPTAPCTRALSQVDAYVDGVLSPEDTAWFESHCATCSDCAEELALARRLRAALHTLPARPCPNRVTDAVFSQIRTQQRAARQARVQTWIDTWLRPAWRPAAALAAVLALVLTVTITRPQPETTDPAYTSAEVEQAIADVQWTLAYLNNVGQRTGRIVRDDVIEPHVVAPVQRTLGDLVSDP